MRHMWHLLWGCPTFGLGWGNGVHSSQAHNSYLKALTSDFVMAGEKCGMPQIYDFPASALADIHPYIVASV